MNLAQKVNLFQNMGLRYVAFRVWHIVKTKTGILRATFPENPKNTPISIGLEEWRQNTPKFFFESKEHLSFEKDKNDALKTTYEKIKQGEYTFFSKRSFALGKSYDWITNPETQHKYNLEHWSQIQDLSKEAGDIKFVWEKARFSFLYDIIRYDYHFEEDCAALVFDEIDSFIQKNPINLGPNYKCSQEISLRVLNWTFALYYYKNSDALTEERFSRIMEFIYWQLHHVYHNIHFSRIAVRNNHAITETLMLFLGGLLFPFLPNTKKWSAKGKKWFEEEIAYQIYKDGTFLQFSMNYHRVAVQLLTWGIRLSEIHSTPFKQIVSERAQKSLEYLRSCQDTISGKLPNYGANDGALFFKLTNDDYRVYTSQLNDLSAVLNKTVSVKSESQNWYGLTDLSVQTPAIDTLNSFEDGGYYVINEEGVKTFIKCGKYKDRPSQSDNLHLDIWVDGINYLWDTGSYKYNTEKKYSEFFGGVEGHNTLSVDGKNQMQNGMRFIWYYWVKKATGLLKSSENDFNFEGAIIGFPEAGKNIEHKRVVAKRKNQNFWQVQDTVHGADHKDLSLYWHLNPEILDKVEITVKDTDGDVITPEIEEKWCSNYYGEIEKSIRYTFTARKGFYTDLKINNQ